MYQFFDVILGEATEWLSAMSHTLPLFPTVTWSCVLHGLHAVTTASPPSLSLSPFKISMSRPACLYDCRCPSMVLEPSALCTNWDALSRSLRTWLGTPALRFYLFSPEPPAVLLEWLNNQPFLYGVSAERVTSSLRASCVFQERVGDAVVSLWGLARARGLTGITPDQRLRLQPVVRASGGIVLTPPVIHRLDCGVHSAGSPSDNPLTWCEMMFTQFAHPLVAVPTPGLDVTCPTFDTLWETELEVRRSALAPRWNAKRKHLVYVKNWDAVFDSWDRVNAALGLVSQSHLRRLHTMRMTRASVRDEGCWVYVLWCVSDGRVYVGQTGGRDNFRSVGVRGREHICLGCDFLRVRGGEKIFLPRNVYRWVAMKGVENFVITPMQFCSSFSVNFTEGAWMKR